MKKTILGGSKLKWVVPAVLIVPLVITFVLWMSMRPPRDSMFRGKPESQWIENLEYSDEEQVEQWRDYGPEGVRVLIRGLERADRPLDRVHRRFYSAMSRFLPRGLMEFVPTPPMDQTRSTRMRIVSLLSSLSKDAELGKLAAASMVAALEDENSSVRQIAISFYTSTEGENALINQLDPEFKRKLLPIFVERMREDDSGIRNNAAIALRYYPEEREIVAPVLVEALESEDPRVRLLAARALNHVAPDRIVPEGVVPMAIKILKNPDDQIAHRAAELLGEMGKEPSLSVPALIEALQGTNSLIASRAAGALGHFEEEAPAIVPVLQKAADNPDNQASHRFIEKALERLETKETAKPGNE